MDQPILTLAICALIGLATLCATLLRGWQGWLALKSRELDLARSPEPSSSMPRIEIADLKERIRKLEAIAAGVDL